MSIRTASCRARAMLNSCEACVAPTAALFSESTAFVIVGADTNTTPQAVIAEAKASGKSIVDLANARGMYAQSLEIFLGLVYLSYMDDPEKEARGRT